LERSIACLAPSLVRGIEAVPEQVEKHTRDVLWNQLDRRNVLAVRAL
jgi:hypothetical protein